MTQPVTYSYQEVFDKSKEYFHTDELASSVFSNKYALQDKQIFYESNPDDLHHRMAKEFARIEKKKFKNPLSEERLYQLFYRFRKIVPQGSPMFGIGNPFQIISLSNCFVVDSPKDSYGGICKTDQEIVQISKRRGGIGYDIAYLRPKNTHVKNAARTTTGGISFMHRFSNTGREVGQGGRRAAQMITNSIHYPDIEDFITIKADDISVTGANISVRLSDEFLNAVEAKGNYELRWPVDSKKPKVSHMTDADTIWRKIIHNAWKRAEPGILFWDMILKECPANYYEDFLTISTNPCLTSETPVYVADGRGLVTIGELAKTGTDVDVFCMDSNNKVCVRKMRHPRLTGKQQQILKVTLDDGSVIRCTTNHKFLLKNGEYRSASELRFSDSLQLVTRFEASMKDIFPKCNSKSQDYYWINSGFSQNKAEHRVIAETQYGEIPTGHVVHHRDYNAKNNHYSNLEVMSKEAHDELHAKDMMGDKNPMRRAQTEWSKEKWATYKENMSAAVSGTANGRYIDVSNEELLEHAKVLTINLGRRFSTVEWENYATTHGLPMTISKFRMCAFDNVKHLSELAAISCNLVYIKQDPRVIKTFDKMVGQGYNAKIVNNQVFVERTCETCQAQYWIEHGRREGCFCSQKCVQHKLNTPEVRLKVAESRKKYEDRERARKCVEQINVFNILKTELGRIPKQDEWEQACKKNQVVHRIGKHSHFKTYSDLKEYASNFNHKVVSVEIDGYEDVYNGTVDEFHNFLVGGFESKTQNGKNKWSFLVNRQCGEITLSAYDSCRLLAMNLWGYIRFPFTKDAYFDYKSFYEDAKIAQRLMDDLIDLELECIDKILAKIDADPEDDEIKFTERNLWIKIREACFNGRRTGLGITALGDVLAGLNIKYGSEESIVETERIYQTLKFASYESSADMAEELGPFPVWDWNLEKACPFIQRFGNEKIELNGGYVIYGSDLLHRMSKVGRRNIANLTTAPTGTLSMLCEIADGDYVYNNTTSGIEPAFLLWYERLKKGNPGDSGFRSDFIDKSGDHWMKFKVYHSGHKLWMDVTGETDETKSPYYGACADDLKWTQRVKLQAAAQRHVDHSISSTVNIPEDITEEEVSKIYTTAWKSGCKGITVYRKNCRSGVLIDPNSKNDTKIANNDAEKRKEVLPCDIFNVKIKGERFFTLVGLQDGPYEIFVGKLDFDLEGNDKGSLRKLARGKYQLLDEAGKILCPNITDYLTDEEQVLTRLISTSLRHHTPIEFILHQIEKTTGELQSPAKVLGRVLKKYIKDGAKVTGESCPNCQSELIRKEGCVACMGCGYSKC